MHCSAYVISILPIVNGPGEVSIWYMNTVAISGLMADVDVKGHSTYPNLPPGAGTRSNTVGVVELVTFEP